MTKFLRKFMKNSKYLNIQSFNLNTSSKEIQYSRLQQLRPYSYKMCKSKDCPPITIRLAHPPDYDRIVSFMKDVFFKCDPACLYLGIPDPPHHILLASIYENLKVGMTLIATEENHCIVGTVINTVAQYDDPIKAIQLANCCLPRPEQDLIKFYSHINTQSKIFEKYCVSQIFDISYLAVEPEWQNMGIAKKLIEKSWYLARDCAFDIIRFDCTNSHSSHIAENFGWECIYKIPYKRYIDHNEQVFKNITEPHLEARVHIDLPKKYEDDTLHYGDCKNRRK